MSTLDSHLDYKLSQCITLIIQNSDGKQLKSSQEENDIVADIKQAFADANYIQAPQTGTYVPIVEVAGSNLMTGQEFYDRFREEITKVASHPDTVTWPKDMVMLAAKRAAGLEK